MNYSCTIKVEGDQGLYDALKPDKSKTQRAIWNLSKKKNTIEIKIEAMDIIALKAFTTSMVKLIEVYEKVQKTTSH
ncbi:MAG: hypothetical protein KAQ83_02510 [Nanoarchaeota archaeon]|nr:hypothetical protein [Nanoarchaeota archaeon]